MGAGDHFYDNYPWYLLGLGIIFAIASLALTKRKLDKLRMAKRRQVWDSRDKDVVTLHMFHRAKTGPNPSPFPIKLETYLRMMDIKYIPDSKVPQSSKGKSPWITVNGTDVADSQLAIEHLTRTLGKDVEEHLSPEEKAVSRSLRSLLEDHLYFCVALERWVYDEGRDAFAIVAPFSPSWIPEKMQYFLLKRLGRNLIEPQAKAQGMGRHTKEEVENFGKADITALSEYLGNKAFLLGDKPCLADLTLFSFVCMIDILPKNSRSVYKPHVENNCRNLLQHHERMKELYWPDYDKCKFATEGSHHYDNHGMTE